MAGTSVYHTHGAQEINIVELFVKAAIGASGAPTINTSASKGVESITRNDTGDYTVLLKEAYNSLLMVDAMLVEADDTDLTNQVISEDVLSAKTVKVGFKAAATPADPPDGSTVLIRITLKNSSV